MTETTRTHTEQQKKNAGERPSLSVGYDAGLSGRAGLSSPQADILALQRAAGNGAVSRLLQPGTGCPWMLQAKLTISQPGDRYEQEADRVANQVMRMLEPRMQRQGDLEEEEDEVFQTKPLAEQITPLVQLQPMEEEEEKEFLLARQGAGQTPDVTPELESRIGVLRGGGQALDSGVRAQMEPAFGCDFSGIRVHTDAQADALNRVLNARAFATGRDVFFQQGTYNPGSSSGRELLAHELVHIVQQQRSLEAIQRGVRRAELTPQEEFEWDLGILRSEIAELENLSPEQKLSRSSSILKMYGRVSSNPYFADVDPKVQEEIRAQINAIKLNVRIEELISSIDKWIYKLPKEFKDESRKVISCMTSEGIHLQCGTDDDYEKCFRKTIESFPWVKCLKQFAKRHCPDVENLTEDEKQRYFKTDINCTVSILMYEFATDTGPPTRFFGESAMITQVFKGGPAVEQALADFYEKNRGKSVDDLQWTFYEYQFSPTLEPPLFDIFKSIEAHMEAIKEVGEKGTWGLAFVGGVYLWVIPKGNRSGDNAWEQGRGLPAPISYITPKNDMLRIAMLNITGKESLMLHALPDIKRDPNKLAELGTICQWFVFDIPLEPERLKTTMQKAQEGIEEEIESIKKSITECFDFLTSPG